MKDKIISIEFILKQKDDSVKSWTRKQGLDFVHMGEEWNEEFEKHLFILSEAITYAVASMSDDKKKEFFKDSNLEG